MECDPRKKTYKREVTFGIFFSCLAWSMYTNDNEFLQITFAPSLAILGATLGLHEFSENISTKGRSRRLRRDTGQDTSLADRYDDSLGEDFDK